MANKQHLFFGPRVVITKKGIKVYVKLDEAFLQKDKQVGYIYSIKRFEKDEPKQLYFWKDKDGKAVVDGDARYLFTDSILAKINMYH